MDQMYRWITILLTYFNTSLCMGVLAAVLCLLRPLVVRVITPQQRSILWYILWAASLWSGIYFAAFAFHILPVTVWDLLNVPPAEHGLHRGPAFLPAVYEGPGTYFLTLPGGSQVPVALTDGLCAALLLIYLAVAAALAWRMLRQTARLRRLGQAGVPLERREMEAAGAKEAEEILIGETKAWTAPGLPASFVLSGKVYLQAELPQERRALVLRHEFNHIALRHTLIKAYLCAHLVLYWWNPLVWLGYRYTCLDMELSCDAKTMEQLSPEERREYARTLTELGSGERLWDVPLAFGESDGARRVKAIVNWKPLTWQRRLLGLAAAALLLLFLGVPV